MNTPEHTLFDQTLILQNIGRQGSLSAKVIETRTSRHIGDLFRNIKPSTPRLGEVITLGNGLLFSEYQDSCYVIGLRPLGFRQDDWLDPHRLYRVHAQRVEVYFHPEKLTRES